MKTHTAEYATNERNHESDYYSHKRARNAIGAAIAKQVMRRVTDEAIAKVEIAMRAFDEAKIEFDRACNEAVSEVL